MKQENFVRLMELRDKLHKWENCVPAVSTQTLKDDIKDSLNDAIGYVSYREDMISDNQEKLLEIDLVYNFLQWFRKASNNAEVDEDKLLSEVFGRTNFNRMYVVTEKPYVFKERKLTTWKNSLMKRINAYFEQDMVAPEDYSGKFPEDFMIRRICETLLDVISSEAGWRSNDKNMNDDLPNPAVESLVADIGKIVAKA